MHHQYSEPWAALRARFVWAAAGLVILGCGGGTPGAGSGGTDSGASSVGADADAGTNTVAAQFEISEALELCGNIHIPIPQSPQEALARNVRVRLEPYGVQDFSAFGDYQFDAIGIPIGPAGHYEELALEYEVEHPHRELFGPFAWEPAAQPPYRVQVYEDLTVMLETVEDRYALRYMFFAGDPAVEVGFWADVTSTTLPVQFELNYASFDAEDWNVGTPGSTLRPCEPGHGQIIKTDLVFEGATLHTVWESLPVLPLDKGGGRAILRSVEGSIHDVAFAQTNLMDLAARFYLNENGISGEYGGYTGLEQPEMCVVWIDPVPGGDGPIPNLDIMNCDFEVLESLPMILE